MTISSGTISDEFKNALTIAAMLLAFSNCLSDLTLLVDFFLEQGTCRNTDPVEVFGDGDSSSLSSTARRPDKEDSLVLGS
jgi:hypothetical protein